MKKETLLTLFTDLQAVSQTSTRFWDNTTDDEAWNDANQNSNKQKQK